MSKPRSMMTEEQKEKANAYNREYYRANREKKRAYNRAYRDANREKIKKLSLSWSESNREHVRLRHRINYHKNIDKSRQRNREWISANRDLKRKCDCISHRKKRLQEFTLAAMAISNELQNQMKAKGTV